MVGKKEKTEKLQTGTGCSHESHRQGKKVMKLKAEGKINNQRAA